MGSSSRTADVRTIGRVAPVASAPLPSGTVLQEYVFATLAEPGVDLPDLGDLLNRPAWHAKAACRGAGTERFFPPSSGALAPARSVCARCPVIEQCRSAALADPSLRGVWAGTSERERARARRAAGGAPNPPLARPA